MIRRPPISTRTDTLVPYTTLFRSTAAQLITEYGDLETLLARAGEIKQAKRRERLIENAELARISKKLVRLDDDVPVVESIDAFGLRQPVAEDLRSEERRVGQECVSTGRSRWSRYH